LVAVIAFIKHQHTAFGVVPQPRLGCFDSRPGVISANAGMSPLGKFIAPVISLFGKQPTKDYCAHPATPVNFAFAGIAPKIRPTPALAPVKKRVEERHEIREFRRQAEIAEHQIKQVEARKAAPEGGSEDGSTTH
jgi:hypothetical protein